MKTILQTISLLLGGALTSTGEQPNILLICIDDLRPELHCYGVDYIQSPNIDSLAAKGRLFGHHYVQAPTCGASRYAMLTGKYGSYGNQALFQRAKKLSKGGTVTPSLPAWFREQGYTTVSVGKVSHHPGGRGGRNWDSEDQIEMPQSWDRHLMPSGPWKHPRGAMHGLANGETRAQVSKGDMAVFQSFEGPNTAYPDGLILNESLTQLKELSTAEKPFFLAVGFIRPHLPFGSPARYLKDYQEAQLPPTPHPDKPKGETTWHGSGEFRNQYTTWGKEPNTDKEFALELRKHYAACVTYVDTLVGELLASLDESGQRDNTIIALWGDHGWHLGEFSVWGKHTLFEEALHAPLIISAPSMKEPGQKTDAIVETIDLYPTLCDLAQLEVPSGLSGQSLQALLDDPKGKGRPAISYIGDAQSIRDQRYRLVVHKNGSKELYDQTSPTPDLNIADEQPETVKKLAESLQKRLAGRKQ